MAPTAYPRLRIAMSVFIVTLTASACGTDVPTAASPQEPQAPPQDTPAGAPGLLVSPQLFDLVAQWSSEAQPGRDMAGAARAAPVDFVTYARMHAPDLAAEAAQTMRAVIAQDGPASARALGCKCAIVGRIDVDEGNPSGTDWSTRNLGASHSDRVYQVAQGSTKEATSSHKAYSTRFHTRMMCVTSGNQACVGGCTAKLYADVQYSASAYAEAHTWTIWNRAGTTQAVDGVKLVLRSPFAGAGETLFEKGISAQQSARSTAFNARALIDTVIAGVGLYAAIESGAETVAVELADRLVRSFFGIIEHKGGNNGEIREDLNVAYETYFDHLEPITVSYRSDDNLYYGLDLTSEGRLKARGWGYHSETGELKSSYGMAIYLDNFQCEAGVSPPGRAGYWRYDHVDGTALSDESLRQRIEGFFYLGFGVPLTVTQAAGSIEQGVCGNALCEDLESPFNCANDCGSCGDGRCDRFFESATACVQDCGFCGDGVCHGAETVDACIQDCGYCGDGYCFNESSSGCPQDCPAECGDGVCAGEEAWECPQDCSCGSNGEPCQ